MFRRDDGVLLEAPYFVDFITAPAPNAGAVRQNQPSLAAQIEGVLRGRAAENRSGWPPITGVTYWRWGPGAAVSSGMTPDMVAGIFRELLGRVARYWGRFQKVSTVV